MRKIGKKKVLGITLCFAFILSGCSVSDTSRFPTEISKKSDTETITENSKEVLTFDSSSVFENDYFRCSYDENYFSFAEKENSSGLYFNVKSSYISQVPEEQYNTALSMFLLFTSERYINDFDSTESLLKEISVSMLNSHDTPISNYAFSEDNGIGEITFKTQDGSQCYFKLFSSDNSGTLYCSLLRTCPYTSDINPGLKEIYNSIELIEPVEFLSSCPTVTYDDIATGAYNGQKVCIEAVVDKVYHPFKDSCNFSLWYPSQDTYVYKGNDSFRDIKKDSPENIFLSVQPGDIVRYATQIYNDGSFGTTSFLAAQIIGNKDINEIHQNYKAHCPPLDYESVLRNPDLYENTVCSVTGTIFQIIDESTYSVEYLLETASGYVYLSWLDDEPLRSERLLEDDTVTIYGTFEILKTYDTFSGNKTVPQVRVVFVDRR